jgi:hypothetical protein
MAAQVRSISKWELGGGFAVLAALLLVGSYVFGGADEKPRTKPKERERVVTRFAQAPVAAPSRFDPIFSTPFAPFVVRDKGCRREFEVLEGGEVPDDAYVRMTLDPWGGIGTLDVVGEGMPGSSFEKCLRRVELSRNYPVPRPTGVIEIPLTPQ